MADEDARGTLDFSWMKDMREWALKNRDGNLRADHDKHYFLLMVLFRPDEKVVTAYPGWNGDELDGEELRQELHKAVDVVFEKRHAPVDEEL